MVHVSFERFGHNSRIIAAEKLPAYQIASVDNNAGLDFKILAKEGEVTKAWAGNFYGRTYRNRRLAPGTLEILYVDQESDSNVEFRDENLNRIAVFMTRVSQALAEISEHSEG